jgi:dehydrogenase/reductase SDR family member 7B
LFEKKNKTKTIYDRLKNASKNSLIGRIVLVYCCFHIYLGASSGIGKELARELVRSCPSVSLVLSARRVDELNALANELNLDTDRYLVLPLDLEQHACGFESKLSLVIAKFNRMDILINNAGISQRSLIEDTTADVDSRLININYLGTIRLSKAVLSVTNNGLPFLLAAYCHNLFYFSISSKKNKDSS